MASKFFKAFNFIKKKSNTSKISPTITQPRQLKKTMEGIRSKYKKFAFTEAKTAKDRANIVRTKKSIERMNKLQKAQDKRKEGIKASKEVKKMIGTGQADRVGGSVYHRGVREKKRDGGLIESLKKFRDKSLEVPPKLKGPAAQPMKSKDKKAKKDSIKEKILPKKKKDRLEELRKELGMKKGGKVEKKNGKTPFGMLSVKAGIDKNPNPTYADKIAGGKMKSKKKVI
jgi:hypothetical protein